VGLGVNFGGNAGKTAPAPTPAPAPEPTPEPEAPVAQVVRVELDVKFDFDKSVVKPNSYGDVKNLADFMKQYPQTTTVVEGHTDSVGPDAYNQKLSQRRA
ncbi:OmpA family protein, partial [Klebsiella pneumoniae]